MNTHKSGSTRIGPTGWHRKAGRTSAPTIPRCRRRCKRPPTRPDYRALSGGERLTNKRPGSMSPASYLSPPRGLAAGVDDVFGRAVAVRRDGDRGGAGNLGVDGKAERGEAIFGRDGLTHGAKRR